MENSTLNKIWSFLGLTSLALSVNGFLIAQGGDFSFASGISIDEDQGRYTGSLYSLIVSLPFFIIFLLVTHTFIYKNSGRNWVTKFPVAFNAQYKTQTLDVKIYQFFFIIVFLILSLSFIWLLYIKFLGGTAYVIKDINLNKIDPIPITNSEINHLFNDKWGLVNERFKYLCQEKGDDKCHGAMTYFPIVQPWFLLILVIVCTLLTADAILAIGSKYHITKWFIFKVIK